MTMLSKSMMRCMEVTSIGDVSGNQKCVNARWQKCSAQNVLGSVKLEKSWLLSWSLMNKCSSMGNVLSKSAATNFHKYNLWKSKWMWWM